MPAETQRLGPWVITAEYEGHASTPVRMTIEPAPDADPRDLAGGISSTVLREVRTRREITGGISTEDLDALGQRLRRAVDDYGPRDDRTLALVAAYYAAIVGRSHAPGEELGRAMGRALSTAKAAIGAARKRGMLTGAAGSRPGGSLTEEARALL